jgi:hypothetical protein
MPVTIRRNWVTQHYWYVEDSAGQKYCVSLDDWKFRAQALVTLVDAYQDRQTPVVIDSTPLWEGCRELIGITKADAQKEVA